MGKFFKILLWIFALLAVLLAIGYALLPSIGPDLVRAALPPEISLDELEIEYPGVSKAVIKSVDGTYQLESGSAQFALKQVTLDFNLFSQQLTSVTIDSARLNWQPLDEAPTTDELPALILPVLPLEKVSIGSLELRGVLPANLKALKLREVNLVQTRSGVSAAELALSGELRDGDAWLPLLVEVSSQSEQIKTAQLNAETLGSKLKVEISESTEQSIAGFITLESNPAELLKMNLFRSALEQNLARAEPETEFTYSRFTSIVDRITSALSIDGRFAYTGKRLHFVSAGENLLELSADDSAAGIFLEQLEPYLPDNPLVREVVEVESPQRLRLALLEDAVVSISQQNQTEDKLSQLSSSGELTMELVSSSVKLNLRGHSLSVVLPESAKPRLSGNLDFTVEATRPAWQYRDEGQLWEFTDPVIKLSGKLKLSGERSELELAEPSSVEASKLRLTISDAGKIQNIIPISPVKLRLTGQIVATGEESLDLTGSTIALRTSQAASLKYLEPSGEQLANVALSRAQINARWLAQDKLPTLDGVLRASQIGWSPQNILVKNAVLNWRSTDLEKLRFRGDYSLPEVAMTIATEAPRLKVSNANITGKFTATIEQLRSEGSLKLSSTGTAQPFNFNYLHNSGKTLFSLPKIDLQWQELQPIAKPYVKHYADGWAVSSGQLTGSANFSADANGFNGNGELLAADVNASKEALFIRGASDTIRFSSVDPLIVFHNIQVSQIELGSGIGIEELSTKVDQVDDKIVIRDLQGGQFLSGNIALAQATYQDPNLGPAKVALNQVSLADINSLIDMDELFITGRVEMALPVVITGAGFAVEGGRFHTTEPGILRYRKEGQTPEDLADLNIALQALDNFHYDSISGTIGYKPNGEYQLNLVIEGSNPDLYDGYPVVLEPRITGNLPGFLSATLFSGDFGEAIVRQYQAGELDQVIEQQIDKN